MKYIINKTLVFNTDEQTLALYENALLVTRISKPAGRLLLEFIQNEQQIVSRDELLEKVWIRHGFSASNAGLNNYISELRKTFVLLGCHQELIVTLPKKGFRFEADILLSPSAEEKPLCDVNNEEEEAVSSVTRPPGKRVIFSSACIVLFLFGVFIYLNNNEKYYPYQKITKIDNCEIYAVGNNFNATRIESILSSRLKLEDVDCKNDKNDIFYMENRINKNTVRSDLISICKKDKSHRYDSCFNIKTQRNVAK